jgi:outer membrane protein OmpA-like peptidoglycan-associated protein
MSLSFLSRRTFLTLAFAVASFAATAQINPANGLTATFFKDRSLTKPIKTRVDPTIDYNWDNRPPGRGLPSTNYSVRWTGFLQPPTTGVYTFVASTDDGMRIWVDETLILDKWELQEPTDYRVQVPLTGGKAVAFRVEYFQQEYQARAQVRWYLPDEEPASNLPELPGLQAPTPQQISTRYFFLENPTVAPTPVAIAPPPAPDSLAAMPILKSGVQFDLPNVYFETGKARLLPRSARSLDRLADALLAQPTLKIEISGHTDIVGDSAANRRLSESRAERVLEYLTMRGVAPERLSAIGYGATRPIARNNSPAERARNRRVEVMVR